MSENSKQVTKNREHPNVKLNGDNVLHGDVQITTTPTAANHAVNKKYLEDTLTPVPVGTICLWDGSLGSIPDRWALCDGTKGTPDLRNRFVMGTVSESQVLNGGGTHKASTPNHTHRLDHTHSINVITSPDSNHTHYTDKSQSARGTDVKLHYGAWRTAVEDFIGEDAASAFTETNPGGSHFHVLTIHSANLKSYDTGTNDGWSNVPRSIKLFYIIKQNV